jgi:hypothetical protein
MQYWAGLYPEDTQKMISAGVELMMKMTLRLLGKNDGGARVLMLKEVEDSWDEEATDDSDDEDLGGVAGGSGGCS